MFRRGEVLCSLPNARNLRSSPKKREDTTAGRHEQCATLDLLAARNAHSIHSERR